MLSVSQSVHGQETKVTGVIKDSLSNAAKLLLILIFHGTLHRRPEYHLTVLHHIISSIVRNSV